MPERTHLNANTVRELDVAVDREKQNELSRSPTYINSWRHSTDEISSPLQEEPETQTSVGPVRPKSAKLTSKRNTQDHTRHRYSAPLPKSIATNKNSTTLYGSPRDNRREHSRHSIAEWPQDANEGLSQKRARLETNMMYSDSREEDASFTTPTLDKERVPRERSPYDASRRSLYQNVQKVKTGLKKPSSEMHHLIQEDNDETRISAELSPILVQQPLEMYRLDDLEVQLASKKSEIQALRANIETERRQHNKNLAALNRHLRQEYSLMLEERLAEMSAAYQKNLLAFQDKIRDLENLVLRERQEKEELVKACDAYFDMQDA